MRYDWLLADKRREFLKMADQVASSQYSPFQPICMGITLSIYTIFDHYLCKDILCPSYRINLLHVDIHGWIHQTYETGKSRWMTGYRDNRDIGGIFFLGIQQLLCVCALPVHLVPELWW